MGKSDMARWTGGVMSLFLAAIVCCTIHTELEVVEMTKETLPTQGEVSIMKKAYQAGFASGQKAAQATDVPSTPPTKKPNKEVAAQPTKNPKDTAREKTAQSAVTKAADQLSKATSKKEKAAAEKQMDKAQKKQVKVAETVAKTKKDAKKVAVEASKVKAAEEKAARTKAAAKKTAEEESAAKAKAAAKTAAEEESAARAKAAKKEAAKKTAEEESAAKAAEADQSARAKAAKEKAAAAAKAAKEKAASAAKMAKDKAASAAKAKAAEEEAARAANTKKAAEEKAARAVATVAPGPPPMLCPKGFSVQFLGEPADPKECLTDWSKYTEQTVDSTRMKSRAALCTCGAKNLETSNSAICPAHTCSSLISAHFQAMSITPTTSANYGQLINASETLYTKYMTARAKFETHVSKHCTGVNGRGKVGGLKLMKKDMECKSKQTRVQRPGDPSSNADSRFDSLESCAASVRKDRNAKFFIYSSFGPRTGRCYIAHTSSETCPEGFKTNTYDFYKLTAPQTASLLGERGLQTAATASDAPRKDLWTTPPKHVDAVTKEIVSQIVDKLKMKFGEWRGWKNNSCEILSCKNTTINLQDPKYTGVVGLSQEELQYVKGFFLWPIVKCTGKKQVAELGGARKLLGSRTPSLAAVARMPGIRRGIGIPKKSGNPMAAVLGKTMSAAAAGIQRKSGTAKKSLTTGSHLGKTMSAFIDKVAKDERYNSIKKLQKFAISEVKLKPMECSGRSIESKEPHAINGVKRICQSALGPRKKATDSPHAF